MAGLVVITRPMIDAQDYAQELQDQGFQTLIEPMMVIDPVGFDAPDLAQYEGILLSSANAMQNFTEARDPAAKPQDDIIWDIPVYCVGKHTAEAARGAGFNNVISVDGTGADLLAYVLALPEALAQRFIHLCGSHVAFPLVDRLREAGIDADALQVYDSRQVDGFSDAFITALKNKEVAAVTFFSKRTAEAFVDCADKVLGESESESIFSAIKALSISTPVVECVRVLPWAASYGSKTPDRVGMMQLLKAYV